MPNPQPLRRTHSSSTCRQWFDEHWAVPPFAADLERRFGRKGSLNLIAPGARQKPLLLKRRESARQGFLCTGRESHKVVFRVDPQHEQGGPGRELRRLRFRGGDRARIADPSQGAPHRLLRAGRLAVGCRLGPFRRLAGARGCRLGLPARLLDSLDGLGARGGLFRVCAPRPSRTSVSQVAQICASLPFRRSLRTAACSRLWA